jgi:hypothetical protein
MKRFLVRMIVAAAVPLVTACYHYVPERGAPLARGTPVRVRLERPRSFELPSLTAHNVGSLTAEMVGEQDGALVLSARWLDAVTGEGFAGQSWTVDVPRSEIAELRVRELSVWRTGVVVAAGVVATWLGFDALGGGGAGGDPLGGGGQIR